MADENETTETTTEAEATETTTEEQSEETTTTTEEVTETTTVEHQGEVVVDKDARADVVGEGDPRSNPEQRVDNIEAAKQQGLVNHQAEHANDNDEGRSSPAFVADDTENEAQA